MSQNSSGAEQRTKTSDDKRNPDQTLYNVVKSFDKDKQNPAPDEENELTEFTSWSKKYNHVSKEIRKNALEQEKIELEQLPKSPIAKYFEGSREKRIQAVKEEMKLLEQMEGLSAAKGNNPDFEEELTPKDLPKNTTLKEEQVLKLPSDSSSSSRSSDESSKMIESSSQFISTHVTHKIKNGIKTKFDSDDII